jgi:hypothetical protein
MTDRQREALGSDTHRAEGRRSLALIEACYAQRQLLELPWSVVPVARERAS